MVTRRYFVGSVGGEPWYGIFKRLKNFPFAINEMALAREKWDDRVNLIAYKRLTDRENGKRRKILLIAIGDHGLNLSFLWRSDEFGVDKDVRDHLKIIGIDVE